MDVIPTRRDQFLHLITVRGDVDLSTAGELLLRLQALAGPASGPILLDLSQVAFMNRAGLRALVILDQAVRTTGGSVHVAALSPQVARLFDLAALHGDPVHVLAPPGFDAVPRTATREGRPGAWASAAV